MHSVGHGCDTTAVETARVDDKFQVLAFHESDILKVQHSFGCRQGIRGQLALPCLVFWGPSETGGFKLFPLGIFRNPVEKNLQSVFPVVPDQQSPFKGKLPVFLLLDNGQFLPYLPCRFRQAEELVPCGDDGFLYL